MSQENDLIEKAGRAAEIGKNNVGWIGENIKVVIIVWLGFWIMFLVSDHKKELDKKDKEIQRLTDRLFIVIENTAIPVELNKAQQNDSLYNAKVNGNDK